MQRLAILLVGLVVLAGASTVQAAENPTGTWKWSVTFNDQTRERSVTLKLEDGKLTGTVPGRNDTTRPIEEGKFENDTVSFKLTFERGDRKFVSVYKGKISGDTLTGTIESERNGEKRSRPWEAKRAS